MNGFLVSCHVTMNKLMNGRAVAGKTPSYLEHSLRSNAVDNQTKEADVSSDSNKLNNRV